MDRAFRFISRHWPGVLLCSRVRKELKIRPGFTPQEDVKRFRSARQEQIEANALPKGHIVGWVPPTANNTITIKPAQSQSARKNAKRSAKRKDKKDDELTRKIAENWDDDDDDDSAGVTAGKPVASKVTSDLEAGEASKGENKASSTADADSLAEDVKRLKV
jgi:partner of Y14 and mago protein